MRCQAIALCLLAMSAGCEDVEVYTTPPKVKHPPPPDDDSDEKPAPSKPVGPDDATRRFLAWVNGARKNPTKRTGLVIDQPPACSVKAPWTQTVRKSGEVLRRKGGRQCTWNHMSPGDNTDLFQAFYDPQKTAHACFFWHKAQGATCTTLDAPKREWVRGRVRCQIVSGDLKGMLAVIDNRQVTTHLTLCTSPAAYDWQLDVSGE